MQDWQWDDHWLAQSHQLSHDDPCMRKKCLRDGSEPLCAQSTGLHVQNMYWAEAKHYATCLWWLFWPALLGRALLGRAMQVKTAMFWTSLTPHTSRAHTGRLDVISKPHVANMWWPKATLLSLTCFWEQSFVFAADSRGLAAILHLQTSTQNERQRVILWVWKVSDSGPKKNLTSDTCERSRCQQIN